jgi:excisionase family DNA binding protein
MAARVEQAATATGVAFCPIRPAPAGLLRPSELTTSPTVEPVNGRLHTGLMPAIDTATRSSTLLTPAETAHLLRVSRRWVYRRASSGELPAVRLGDGPRAPLRIHRHDIAALLHDAAEGET